MIEKKINIDIVYPSTECAREFKSSLSCPLLVFYNCCKWIQLNFKNPTPEHYYAWSDGIQMSRDLNILLLLNCFYLTEYCQVSALNLIGIGHSNVFFFISFIPLLSNVCFWHLGLYKFLIYTVMLYTFSAKYCVLCLHISFSFIKHDRMLRFLS